MQKEIVEVERKIVTEGLIDIYSIFLVIGGDGWI